MTEHWGVSAKNKFIAIFTEKVNQVAVQPESCPKSDAFEGLFKCVVTKQTTFYYRIAFEKDEIEIITIFDTRQDPGKLKKDIK